MSCGVVCQLVLALGCLRSAVIDVVKPKIARELQTAPFFRPSPPEEKCNRSFHPKNGRGNNITPKQDLESQMLTLCFFPEAIANLQTLAQIIASQPQEIALALFIISPTK